MIHTKHVLFLFSVFMSVNIIYAGKSKPNEKKIINLIKNMKITTPAQGNNPTPVKGKVTKKPRPKPCPSAFEKENVGKYPSPTPPPAPSKKTNRSTVRIVHLENDSLAKIATDVALRQMALDAMPLQSMPSNSTARKLYY